MLNLCQFYYAHKSGILCHCSSTEIKSLIMYVNLITFLLSNFSNYAIGIEEKRQLMLQRFSWQTYFSKKDVDCGNLQFQVGTSEPFLNEKFINSIFSQAKLKKILHSCAILSRYIKYFNLILYGARIKNLEMVRKMNIFNLQLFNLSSS